MSKPANEETSLLLPQTNESEYNESVSFEGDGPWPSTFERSISLLAGPQTDVENIDRMTRSPRFVPIQAEKARMKLKKLGRGYNTPDPAGQRISGSPEASSFQPIKKTHSLDYGKAASSKSSTASDKQQLKIASAAMYRQKILETASGGKTTSTQRNERRSDGNDLEMNSPGYHREKATDKHKRKQKEAQKNSRLGESTFWQCVFNMSNVLMVSSR